MAAEDRARVPGFVHAWGAITFKINDRRVYGKTKIGYGDKRTRQKGYGAGRHHVPTRRSPGKYEADLCTTDLYKETAQALREALASEAGDGNSYGNVIFQCEFLATEPGSADLQVELVDCVWQDDKSDHSEGPDGLMDQVTFDCMYIIRDGKTLFDGTEGLPA